MGSLWRGLERAEGWRARMRPLAKHGGLGSVRLCPVFDAVFHRGFKEGHLQVAGQAEHFHVRDGIVSGDWVSILSL